MKNRERAYQIAAYIIIGFFTVLSIFPLIYVLSLSLVNDQEWIQRGGFILFPYRPTIIAYQRLFEGSIFMNSFRVSVVRTILGTAITLSITALTGYIASRKRMPGRKPLLIMVLITILFSGGLIPSYLVVRDCGLRDTLWALLIPVMVDSWSVLVIKQFFENIPGELEEAAEIDGAGEVTKMIRIMFPMSKAVLASIGLFTAVFHWNSWFDAFIYINNAKLMPMQLIMRNMFTNTNLGNQMNPTSVLDPTKRVSVESLKMAVAVMGTIPILCVYPFIQKYFTKGVYLGSVKG